MQYLGGKYRIARFIRAAVAEKAEGRARYVEPFVGGGSTFTACAPLFPSALAADAHEDLALMWCAVAAGWEPPTSVTPEEYAALRHAEPSALRGFVGFGCSFGGKWWGGMARAHKGAAPGYNYAAGAARSVMKSAPAFRGAEVLHADYRDLEVRPDDLVYADPPYAGTTGYPGLPPFDSAEFWRTAERWAASGAVVLVSEHAAPEGWAVVWERQGPDYLGAQAPGARMERLFTWGAP